MCLIIWGLVHVLLVQFLLAMSSYFLALFKIPLLCLSFSLFSFLCLLGCSLSFSGYGESVSLQLEVVMKTFTYSGLA